MATETLTENLAKSINEITRLIYLTEDENKKFELKIKKMELFQQLDRVIIAELSNESEAFKEALSAIKELTQKAMEAKKDLSKIRDTIEKAAKAISKIEKLIKNIAGVLKII
jgi:predicted metal-dependent hydrolase